MNVGISELLAIAIPVFTLGLVLLIRIVSELAPGLRRKWLLAVGLGAGVIAFGFKLVMILAFTSFAEPLLALWPDRSHDVSPNRERPELPHARQTGYTWEVLPVQAPAPVDNPTTPTKVALGRRLFFDKRLSADGTLSCASCHELSPDKAGTDGRAVSLGIGSQKGTRNAPTVLNAAFQRALFWDGRAGSLEEQAKGPITNPIEMGMPDAASVAERLSRIPEYQEWFAEVFGEERPVSLDNAARAIAAYERTLITPDTPYDRFVRGDATALDARQLRGMALFASSGCVLCHSGPNFSEASLFGDSAVLRLFPANPEGLVPSEHGLTEDLGADAQTPGATAGLWRIPTLRNVSRTGPYFHNGSVETLEEAVRIMASAQLNLSLSNAPEDDEVIRWDGGQRRLVVSQGRALSDREVDDIVAFLGALSGDLPTVAVPDA